MSGAKLSPLGCPARNIPKYGHERVEVSVVVAAEEQGASVVRAEPDCDLIVSPADAYDVTDDGIYKVVRCNASTADYVERMAIKVKEMLLEKERSKVVRLLSPDAATLDTHRSASGTTRNSQFNALVRLETVCAAP